MSLQRAGAGTAVRPFAVKRGAAVVDTAASRIGGRVVVGNVAVVDVMMRETTLISRWWALKSWSPATHVELSQYEPVGASLRMVKVPLQDPSLCTGATRPELSVAPSSIGSRPDKRNTDSAAWPSRRHPVPETRKVFPGATSAGAVRVPGFSKSCTEAFEPTAPRAAWAPPTWRHRPSATVSPKRSRIVRRSHIPAYHLRSEPRYKPTWYRRQ